MGRRKQSFFGDIAKGEDGQELGDGGAAGEGFKGASLVEGRERGVVGLPVAVLAENRGFGGTEYGGRGVIACVAEERARVLGKELVGGVNFAVAGEAEFG